MGVNEYDLHGYTINEALNGSFIWIRRHFIKQKGAYKKIPIQDIGHAHIKSEIDLLYLESLNRIKVEALVEKKSKPRKKWDKTKYYTEPNPNRKVRDCKTGKVVPYNMAQNQWNQIGI